MRIVKIILSVIAINAFLFLSMDGLYIIFVWLMNYIGLAKTIVSFLSTGLTLYFVHKVGLDELQ